MPEIINKILNSLKIVIRLFPFFFDLKKKKKVLIRNSGIVGKSVNSDLKIMKSSLVEEKLIKRVKISDKEILYKKSQKIKYLGKLRKDKIFFDQQQYLKLLEINLKNAQRLLEKQKEIFDKNLSLKEVQILILSNKLKDISLLDPNIEKIYSIRVQISQMLFFKKKQKKVDIFPAEDILLHTCVLKLLSIAVIKGIFELYSSIDFSNNFNKFSFIVFYETFDGSSHSLAFSSSLVVIGDDVNHSVNFYEFPEKISFYNLILEFMLHLIEKYEGTSFHKISVFNTSIDWNQLKNAFKSTKIIK